MRKNHPELIKARVSLSDGGDVRRDELVEDDVPRNEDIGMVHSPALGQAGDVVGEVGSVDRLVEIDEIQSEVI